MEIKNNIQCKHCPWKVSADLTKIPNYNRQQHLDLEPCIAKDCTDFTNRPVMSCHNSKECCPEPCIGYLVNQLGIGNNIPLRLKVRNWDGIESIKTVGKQLETFEETLRNTTKK